VGARARGLEVRAVERREWGGAAEDGSTGGPAAAVATRAVRAVRAVVCMTDTELLGAIEGAEGSETLRMLIRPARPPLAGKQQHAANGTASVSASHGRRPTRPSFLLDFVLLPRSRV
jgi:hypothetical protein